MQHCFWDTDREDKLNADNKSVVTSYRAELAKRLSSLCSTVASSISQQDEQLQCVDRLCHCLLNTYNEVAYQIPGLLQIFLCMVLLFCSLTSHVCVSLLPISKVLFFFIVFSLFVIVFCSQAMIELKKKMMASKSLYISHVEALQNVFRLHKASADASLEEMSSLASGNACSIEEVHLTCG